MLYALQARGHNLFSFYNFESPTGNGPHASPFMQCRITCGEWGILRYLFTMPHPYGELLGVAQKALQMAYIHPYTKKKPR